MAIRKRDVLLSGLFTVMFAPLALLVGRPTFADPAELGINISHTPALDVVAEEDGAKVYAVAPGAVVQLAVSAKLSDGSQRDVTLDAATAYTSLAPESASVDSNGRVAVAGTPPSEPAPVLIVVTRGTFTSPVALRVASN